MADRTEPRRAQWPLTILIVMEGLVLTLRGLHVLSASWTVGVFFLLIIPSATLKAFTHVRRL